MSLRTRLIVAFLLLAVVPLSAVTLYSYYSSVHAFERAVEREATQTAGDIGRRMAMVTDDVGRRMDRLFELSDQRPDVPHASAEEVRARLAPMLGDAAALVDQVEFQPEPEEPNPNPNPNPEPEPTPRPPRRDMRHSPPPPPGPPGTGRGPKPPMPPPIVVNVPQILAQTSDALKKAGVPEIGPKLQTQLGDAIRQSIEASIASKETAAAMAMKEASMKAAASAMSHGSATAQAGVPPDFHVTFEGHDIAVPVRHKGRMVGRARAKLNMDRTLGAILTLARSDQGEIPFALDRRGELYTPDASRRATLESLHVQQVADGGKPRRVGDWVVVTRQDASGLTFGIARPLGESLREIRRTSVRNLSLGLLVVGLAIIGIVPLSHRMTTRLRSLTAGARQLAAGDFRTRVPAASRDEFGELARAFNQMAMDLERHQAMAVEQERLRRELELSRQIQVDMLPRAPLRFGAAEIKGISIPAREVGGDFFNYFELAADRLGLLVGDVSGKGVSAALLMANVQATLRARLPLQPDLAMLANLLDRDLEETTPGGVFVTLFIGVLEAGGRAMRYVNAGHNPQYILRAQGGVERLVSTGLPIGLFAGHGYKEVRVDLAPGDLLFFFTDGLVESENERDEMFGAERVEAILQEEHLHGIDVILERLEREVNAFRGKAEPLDDATMMALRV
jgi:serine phosphatase RsbU (regulator of sigma subunit)